MVTQDEIARNLNISRTTVARAMSGKSVSPKTREKVLKEAERLGYVQNGAAISLATKTIKHIYAFIVATIDEGYGQQMKSGMEEAAGMWQGYNFQLHVIFTDITLGKEQCSVQMEQFFQVMKEEQVDGVIFSALSPGNMDWVSNICKVNHIPLMTVDSLYHNSGLCHVGPDYFNLGTYSAAYLAGLVMKKGLILTLSYDEGYELANRRMEGFYHKLKEYPEICCKQRVLKGMDRGEYYEILERECSESLPAAIYAPYHMDYVGEFLNGRGIQRQVVAISNGINESVKNFLYDGTLDGIVSARPYFLGAVVVNNFFKFFYRVKEMLTGEIDVACDIYIKENYKRYDKIF